MFFNLRDIDTQQFIEWSSQVYGDKYNYSLVKYQSSRKNVKIICCRHGEFSVWPSIFLNKRRGCILCEREEKWKSQAKEKWDDVYDYTESVYIHSRKIIKIRCKKHDIVYYYTPDAHLYCSNGCPECMHMHTESFINQSIEKHGDIYDYSKTVYAGHHKRVIVICKTHGEFSPLARRHITGGGDCKKCELEKRTKNFYENTLSRHGDDITLVSEYKTTNEKISFFCKKHGHFEAFATTLRKSGCAKCAYDKIRKKSNDFINEARYVHGSTYDYSEIIYKNNKTPIVIICRQHGRFHQSPCVHLRGSGCPRCSHKQSKLEIMWLDSLSVPIRGYKIKIDNKKWFLVDGFNPTINTVYEFNGDFWHGNPEKYKPTCINRVTKTSFGELYTATVEKKKILENLGYTVISIWESDWINQMTNAS